jgi:hypothetical protein
MDLLVIVSLFWLAGCALGPSGHLINGGPARSVELAEGVRAFHQAEYEKAKRLFNAVIVKRGGSADLEEARWYLAMIEEKQGNRSEAVQRYAEFLHDYPASRYREEAKGKLVLLRSQPSANATGNTLINPGEPIPSVEAAAPLSHPSNPSQSASSTPPVLGRAGKPRYVLTGSLTTEYLYDQQLSPAPSDAIQNRLSEYLNFRWKNNVGPDIRLYFYGSNSNDFLDQAHSRYRIYKLFAEWNDLGSVLNLRAGRQPASGNTLFSRFDGVALSYRPSMLVSVNVSAGFPVSTTFSDNLGMQSDQRFYEAYVTVYDWYHFGGKLYATQEFYQSFLTRSAVGLNGYWAKDNVNLSTILDYDVDFARFNDLLLSADYAWGSVRYSGAVEYRKNPFLDYETALMDPNSCGAATPATSFGELDQQLSRSAIQSCALKNTSHSMNVRAGVSIDFSKVWHGDLQYAHTDGTALDLTTTGAVTTVGQTDQRSDRVSLFLSERNGLHVSEVWTLLLLYQPSTDYQTLSVFSTLSRYWGRSLQASLQFRGDQTTFHTTGTKTTRWVPGFILSYFLPSGITANLEGDYEMDHTSGAPNTTILETRTTITIPF